MLVDFTHNIYSAITLLKLLPYLPGANEFRADKQIKDIKRVDANGV